jgi:hypothetical protein
VHEPASLIPPRDLSGFVVRERESTELIRLLSEAPLVTLAGPGGAGKTRNTSSP